MFYVIGVAVVVGMASVLWWALKHGRTPFWFFGFANSRAERPILYWIQIISYGACMALVVYVMGAIVLAAVSS